MIKDYHQILEVPANCGDEELRKNYRRLAMRYHPDRNPDDPAAEEKFKDVAEAYGVLSDPVKRREYQRCRARGTSYAAGDSGGFSYSQEDILRDLFRDPRFQAMFSGLLREFQRSGFRHSPSFIRNSLFAGKGGIFLGGIMLFGSLAAPLISRTARKAISDKGPALQSLGRRVGRLLGRGKKKTAAGSTAKPPVPPDELDITYHTPLTAAELLQGKSLNILVYATQGEQTLQVKVPPNSRGGQKLRLRGQGRPGPHGRGDLYLHLVEKKE